MRRLVSVTALLAMVAAAAVNCDGAEEEDGVQDGFVYAGVMEAANEQVYKLTATEGEKVFGIGGSVGGFLSIAVDPASGDVYIYSTNSLKKYSKAGKEIFDVYIYSGLYYDKMVFDSTSRDVWVYVSRTGDLSRHSKDDGAEVFSFATGLTGIKQLLYDGDENALWLLSLSGSDVVKFSTAGERLLELNTSGEFTAMALDPGDNTLLVGYVDTTTGYTYVRRYSKTGDLADEFRVVWHGSSGVNYLGVQPGRRYIWVSGGYNTEIYDSAGNLWHVIKDFTLLRGDFDRAGKLFFGIASSGEISALRLSSFETLWVLKTATTYERALAIKASGY